VSGLFAYPAQGAFVNARTGQRRASPRRSQRVLHVGPVGASVFIAQPWPAKCAVEHFADGVQGDPIVLGTDQEIQPGERSIEKSCRAMAG
jgi:hypothetical protein